MVDLFASRHPEVILTGPAGTGKSRAALEKIHRCMWKYPGARALIIRDTRASLTDSALVTFESHVLPEQSPVRSGPDKANRHSYKFPNGSEIVLGGLDNILRYMSTEFDMIFGQEWIEALEDHHEMLLTRLRGRAMPYCQFIGDTNPGAPTHWIKNRPELLLIETRHEDNPVFWDAKDGKWTEEGQKYLDKLATTTGHRKDRMLYGRWVSAEGARFTQLDERVHRFKFYDKWPSGLPSSLHILLGFDWGTAAPCCALWMAVDHNEDIWVFREFYKSGLTTPEQAAEVVRLTKQNEIVRYAYGDPAMWAYTETHTGPAKKSDADYFTDAFARDGEDRKRKGLEPRFGSFLRGFNKSRRLNETTVDELLTRGNGYPNVYIEEGCTNLWAELVSAVWDRDPEKEQMDASCPDHAITAFYYAAHTYREAPKVVDEPDYSPENMHALRVQEHLERSRKRFQERARRVARATLV